MRSKKSLRFISSPVSVFRSLGEERPALALQYVLVLECAELSVLGTTAGVCARIFFFPCLPLEFVNEN